MWWVYIIIIRTHRDWTSRAPQLSTPLTRWGELLSRANEDRTIFVRKSAAQILRGIAIRARTIECNKKRRRRRVPYWQRRRWRTRSIAPRHLCWRWNGEQKPFGTTFSHYGDYPDTFLYRELSFRLHTFLSTWKCLDVCSCVCMCVWSPPADTCRFPTHRVW